VIERLVADECRTTPLAECGILILGRSNPTLNLAREKQVLREEEGLGRFFFYSSTVDAVLIVAVRIRLDFFKFSILAVQSRRVFDEWLCCHIKDVDIFFSPMMSSGLTGMTCAMTVDRF
jgi:hypothetical protein